MKRKSLPDIPFCFNSEVKPLGQTLSDAFFMSIETPRTLYPSSNDAYIPWVIDKSSLIYMYPVLKPDRFVEIMYT